MRRAIFFVLILCTTQAWAQLVNPGFEEGMEGWSTWLARASAKAQIIAGEKGHGQCLQITGESASRLVVSQKVPVQPQTHYQISYRYWAAPLGARGGSMGYMRLQFNDGNDHFMDYPAAEALLDTFGQWMTQSVIVKTPLSAAFLSLTFNQTGASDLRIDDVSLKVVPAPAPLPNTWSQLATRRPEPLWFPAWQYNHSAAQFVRYGLKYGWQYEYEEQFDEVKESRSIGLWRDEKSLAMLKQKQLPATIYLYFEAEAYRKAHYNGEPPEDIPYMIDPVWHDGYVHACEQVCRELAKEQRIAHIFVQDESFGRWSKAPLPVDKRVSTAFWEGLENEVRTKYGHGEFGLPTGPDDPDPYRWMAYLSWANDRWVETFARLRQVIDDSGCGAQLLGPDEVGVLQPLPWCDLAQYVDVFTGQCLFARGSARQYVAGWTTKFSRDLTQKEVFNATQVVKYSGSPSPEEVQRQYSEVLQNGGAGQMLIAVEWFDRELNHHKYSAPAWWATIKNLLTSMANYQIQTPQQSSVALLFSSLSHQALGNQQRDTALLSLYALLGPRLQAWPQVVDTYALARHHSALDGFKIAVAPYIPYENPEVCTQLQKFVRGGGTLIITDPQALQTDSRGLSLNRSFLGATVGEAVELPRTLEMNWPWPGPQRSFGTEAYRLQPSGRRTDIIARYPDGKAAVTSHADGQGRVILFGTNPLTDLQISEDTSWQQWWREVLRRHDVPMKLPIWQLRLPDSDLVQATRPEGRCLTGNNFVRCQNGVYLGANDLQAGHYTLSVAPDRSPEQLTGEIPFDQGNLTNRVKATAGPFESSGMAKEPYREADWTNRWSGQALQQGLEIEFVFAAAHELSKVVLWYSGTLPALTVESQNTENAAWQPLTTLPGQQAGSDVREVTMPLAATGQRLRLRLAPGTDELAIGDIEIWGP
jgi:hypothetical protein